MLPPLYYSLLALAWRFCRRGERRRGEALTVHLEVDNPEEIPPMTRTLTTTQFTTIRIKKIADARGNAAPVDGFPSWTTDHPEVLALAPSSDGMSCKVSAVGAVGLATVTTSVDADLGDGVKTIQKAEAFQVIHALATAIEDEVDEPAEIDDATAVETPRPPAPVVE